MNSPEVKNSEVKKELMNLFSLRRFEVVVREISPCRYRIYQLRGTRKKEKQPTGVQILLPTGENLAKPKPIRSLDSLRISNNDPA